MRSAKSMAFCPTSSFSKLNIHFLSTLNQRLSTSFIASLRQVHRLEMERLAMQFRRLSIALEFPREHCCVIFVVAERFAIGCLVLLAKMRSGRFVTLERVHAHQLGEFQEIGNASGAFQGLVKIFVCARDAHIAPELFSQFGDFLQRLAQTFLLARHSAFVPEKKAEFSVEGIERAGAIDLQEFLNPNPNIFLYLLK